MTPAIRLHDSLLGDPEVARHFSGRTQLQRLLEVEAALAEAEASVGVVPTRCVGPIREAADATHYSPEAIAAEAVPAGNVVIPLVRHLTARVATADPEAARYVHWGATSQDILDTALVLQLRDAVPTIVSRLALAAERSADMGRRYVDTPMVGRTWLQHATPITFGLKAAGWLDALDRTRERLQSALDEALVLQLGGAAGTLASLGERGLAVAAALATGLGLQLPDLPWHTHRDRLAQLACALGVATGVVGKIGRDLTLLAQTEVGEVAEEADAGRGGSSTMPQKRNPVAASVAVAAGLRAPALVSAMLSAMLQEHERGVGSWQTEWDTLPDLVVVSAGGARGLVDALGRLAVDTERMREQLRAGGGTVLAEAVAMTLAESVGKHDAHARVAAACREAAAGERGFAEVLAADPVISRHLDRTALERCLTPERYLGVARELVTRVLARHAGGKP